MHLGTFSFDATPTNFDVNAEGEVALDIEMVAAIAPKAHVYLYEQDVATNNPVLLLAQIADDALAQVVSSSWTWGGTGSAADANIPSRFPAVRV